MTGFKFLLALLTASCMLTAFLGYRCYVFQIENLRLKNELQSLSQSYAELQDKYPTLSDEFNSLNQTHNMLMQNYTMLLTNYVNLLLAYASLNETYNSLLHNYTELANANLNYTELLKQYQSLMQNYTQLKSEYDELFTAFYEPLQDEFIPTVAELVQWLAEDKTDEIGYTYPNFVCGDFAVMLHMHAKLRHWDMGVVGVLGNLSDGSEFNHAFNAITCQEGLRYIEPQNDAVFETTIDVGASYYHPWFGNVIVREFIIVILYDGE
ncbi:MAG: hypothetical protein QW270_01585 [Candidatus Bathyarchaeia archaeon]